MSFSGRVVYIAGGTGIVGSGFARCLLKEGAKVAVSSRSQQRLDDLSELVDKDLRKNLILIKEDIGTEEGAKKILKLLQEQHGGVQHVMSSIGAWWQGGSLTNQSVEDFDKHMDQRAKSHFICCKTFLPVLAKYKDTTYTFITGLSYEGCFRPDISLLCVGNAALVGISMAAQAEFKDSNVAVNEVRIGIFIKPKLNKDLEKSTMDVDGMTVECIGHDVIGDLLVNINKARIRGLVRIVSRKDIDTNIKECQKKIESKT